MFKEVAFIFSCSRSSSDFPPNGIMIIWLQISSLIHFRALCTLWSSAALLILFFPKHTGYSCLRTFPLASPSVGKTLLQYLSVLLLQLLLVYSQRPTSLEWGEIFTDCPN